MRRSASSPSGATRGAALRRAWLLGGALVLLGAGAGLGVFAAAPTWDVPDLPREAAFRMLAVGDTGHPPKPLRLLDPQRAVGAALAASDRAAPADVLVLLGDNFYPDGLRGGELEERIAGNLVAPYCHFLALDAPRSAAVADACGEAGDDRHPIPLRAVLGNHDYGALESPELQAEAIPEYVTNWRLERGGAFVEEYAGGVSVVYFDSTPGRARSHVRALGDALREARGPWRIVVAHHPIDESAKGEVLRAELARAGVPVHLWLAGHEHNLQISVPGAPGPALQAIAGSGSHATALKYPIPGRKFHRRALGYARVDLVAADPARPERSELQVALVATRGRPFAFWERAHVVARWGVEPDGAVRRIAQEPSDPLRHEGDDVADEPLE